jgi:hypothetical protein
MKKDIVIALVVGGIIGCLSALSITYLPTLFEELKNRDAKTIAKISTAPVINPQSSIGVDLNLDNPNNSISDSKQLVISGKSNSGNMIALDGDYLSNVYEASKDGSFQFTVNLTEGLNRFYLTSFDQKGNYSTKIMDAFYTEEKL